MKKESNTYSIIYILVLALVVGTALAFTAGALSGRQQANADRDKERQILASIHITAPSDSVSEVYDSHIVNSLILNNLGDTIEGNAFNIDVAEESRKPDSLRMLPVFVGKTDSGELKYIIPAYGAGLWGPIWGYVAFNADGKTIYGAYFAHQGETPGLGAEIEKPAFSARFIGKQVFKDGKFMPISVVKSGTRPSSGEDYVDGVSGGTITSNGVTKMLANCLSPYEAFLQSLSDKPINKD